MSASLASAVSGLSLHDDNAPATKADIRALMKLVETSNQEMKVFFTTASALGGSSVGPTVGAGAGAPKAERKPTIMARFNGYFATLDDAKVNAFVSGDEIRNALSKLTQADQQLVWPAWAAIWQTAFAAYQASVKDQKAKTALGKALWHACCVEKKGEALHPQHTQLKSLLHNLTDEVSPKEVAPVQAPTAAPTIPSLGALASMPVPSAIQQPQAAAFPPAQQFQPTAAQPQAAAFPPAQQFQPVAAPQLTQASPFPPAAAQQPQASPFPQAVQQAAAFPPAVQQAPAFPNFPGFPQH